MIPPPLGQQATTERETALIDRVGVKPGAALVGLDHKDRPRLVLACLTDEMDG